LSLLALSPAPDRDIREAVRYFRQNAGVEVARSFAAALRSTGELLAGHPEMGRRYRRTQTGIELRASPLQKFGQWLLSYDVVKGGEQRVVFIHRLLHGSRCSIKARVLCDQEPTSSRPPRKSRSFGCRGLRMTFDAAIILSKAKNLLLIAALSRGVQLTCFP